MPPKRPTPKPTPPEQNELGLERIVFFSDAVMAIAITLLAIDLKVPEISPSQAAAELPAQFSALTPRIMSFVISFAVVGIYWTAHHRYFRYIKRYDGGLIALNLLFLLFIVVMPFVAGILGQYAYLPVGVIPYSAAVAAIGFVISALWFYASHNHRLVDASLDDHFIRTRTIISLVIPLVFLVSIPFAFLSPVAAIVVWWASPLISGVTQRLSERWQAPKKRGR